MITRGYKNWARLAAVGAAAAIVVGCGDDPVTPVVAAPAGNVVQFPVENARVFADRTGGGGTRGEWDDDEVFAITDSNGRFQLPSVPTYDYELISVGGVDSILRTPAISMRAAGGTAGSAPSTDVLTPLTTLVQLAPDSQRAAVVAAIRSLGVEPTARIDQGVTPAAAALVKAVTTTISQVTEVIRTGSANGLSGSAQEAIQRQLGTSFATKLAEAPPATTLASVASIKEISRTATQTALTTLTTEPTALPSNVSISVGDISAVANAAANSTAAFVARIEQSAGSLTTNGAKREEEIVDKIVQDEIKAQTDSQFVANITNSAVVVAVVPANNPPTFGGPSTATATVGQTFNYESLPSDPDRDPVLSVTIESGSLPAGLTLNQGTGVIAGTPTTTGVRSISLKVSDGRNGSGTLVVTITVTAPPTGAVGTGGGSPS